MFSLATESYSFITMSFKYVANGELSFVKSYALAKGTIPEVKLHLFYNRSRIFIVCIF